MRSTRYVLAVAAAAVALFAVAPAQADLFTNLIVNGDFEQVGTNNDFPDWTYSGSSTIVPSTDSVISGTRSAKIGWGSGAYPEIRQDFSDPSAPRWQFDMDFAMLEGSDRSVSVLIRHSLTPTEMINLKVDAGEVFVVDGGSWFDTGITLPVGAFTSGTSWSGQDPVSNHLTIEGFYDDPAPYYTISVNGSTPLPLTKYQFGVASQGDGIMAVSLRGGDTGDLNYYLADNVSLMSIPEPTSLVLLLCAAWAMVPFARRRRN